MKLTIELTPSQEARLFAAAQTEGIDLSSLAQRLVTDHLPEIDADAVTAGKANPCISSEDGAAIALLDSWLVEDATEDPEVIRLAEEELEELKRNMNANRGSQEARH